MKSYAAFPSWLLQKIRPDQVFGQVLRNAIFLFSGNTVAALLDLAALVLAARYLEPHHFGMLILIHTYALIVDKLFNFQSWQALIKFGADFRVRGDWSNFKGLIKRLLLLDLATAVVATVVGLIGIAAVAPLLGWTDEARQIAALFCIALAFHLSGVPIGILRLFDGYGPLVVQDIVTRAIKVVGVLAAITVESGLLGVAIAWVVADILGQIIYWTFCTITLKQHALLSFPMHRAGQIDRLWSFVWTTNANAAVRMLSREFDIVLVNVVLGSTSVGIYKIAKQLGSLVQRATDPLYVSIYPELTRQKAFGNYQEFIGLMKSASLSAGGFGIVVWLGFVLVGSPLITFIFGSEYSGVYLVLVFYLIALFIALLTLPLQPAMLAFGQASDTLKILLVSTILYLAALVPLMGTYGVAGAAVAYILFYVAWGGGMAIRNASNLRHWATAAQGR